jgi:hypothetical protein
MLDVIYEITDGRLALTNHEDLSMAAQFEDESIPSRHNAGLSITLANGMYIATVRQMFDPGKGLDPSPGTVHFEVVLARVDSSSSISMGNYLWVIFAFLNKALVRSI